MNLAVSFIHFICCFIVLSEALNKLERSSISSSSSIHVKTLMLFKIFSWGALAVGSFFGVLAPLMPVQPPSFADMLFALGCATLIVRTRIKEEYIYGARRKQTANG